MNYETVFKAIDDILWKDDGCTSEIDYVEQSSWLIFLKYLNDLENEQEAEAMLSGKDYHWIIKPEMRWNAWAAPKTAEGKNDEDNAMTGDPLIRFVNGELFPYLQDFKKYAQSADTIEYKIGEIFSELSNKIRSGYSMRDVLWEVDKLSFESSDEHHQMTVLYEMKLAKMGNAGRNGGEYYTPRPLIRTIVRVVDPKVGETVYDPACGSAGFLCEAFTYMNERARTTDEKRKLQKGTFFGQDNKVLPYLLGTMNLIFHGLKAPNIIRANTLAQNQNGISRRDQKDVILANPPFGGKERAEVRKNFTIETGETAYMFMQHFIKMLKPTGRAGIVIKNTFLSNMDNASVALRRELLTSCNLHTVLDLPQGVFQAGVKTVVLFFDKGKKTDKVWYYQLNLDRRLGKTQPLTEADLAEFVSLYPSKADSENSWTVSVDSLDENYDLSVNDPNRVEEVVVRDVDDILDEILYLNDECNNLVKQIQTVLRS